MTEQNMDNKGKLFVTLYANHHNFAYSQLIKD